MLVVVEKDSKMITVFTPTYNRAYLLPRLYESLKSQTFKDFEWLIVDDGSTDGTRDLIAGWINERLFNIRYYYQENGGKHRTINMGTQLAKGEWFFIVDSDDILPDNSLEIVKKWIDTVRDDETFAGVCGVKRDITGQTPFGFSFDVLDLTPFEIGEITREDKAEVVKTQILRNYPFPDIEGEKFCAEGLVWNRIGRKYKLRYFNEVIYNYEYLNDGLTLNSMINRRKSPTYATMVYREQLPYLCSMKKKLKVSCNYWRFWGFAKKVNWREKLPTYTYLLLPFGLLMMIFDSIKIRMKE